MIMTNAQMAEHEAILDQWVANGRKVEIYIPSQEETEEYERLKREKVK